MVRANLALSSEEREDRSLVCRSRFSPPKMGIELVLVVMDLHI